VLTGPEVDERAHGLVWKRAVLAGDRVPMWARPGVAELLRKPRLDFGAEHMFELAGLVVDFVPGHVEVVDQEALAETMTAHERRALVLAFGGQRDACVAVRLHEARRAQAAEHLGDRWRSHAKILSQTLDGDGGVAALQLEQRLEVLLGALRELVHGLLRRLCLVVLAAGAPLAGAANGADS